MPPSLACVFYVLVSCMLSYQTFCLIPSYFIIFLSAFLFKPIQFLVFMLSKPVFSLYALFLACMPSSSPLSVCLYIDLTLGLYALFLACMPSSSHLSVCLYINLTLGLYALFLACMPSSSQLSVYLYID